MHRRDIRRMVSIDSSCRTGAFGVRVLKCVVGEGTADRRVVLPGHLRVVGRTLFPPEEMRQKLEEEHNTIDWLVPAYKWAAFMRGVGRSVPSMDANVWRIRQGPPDIRDVHG